MVYSASAVVALERYRPALPVPDQAGDVGGRSASRCSSVVMRIDYRTYREPVVHLDVPRRRRRSALVAVLFSPPVNDARRWFGVGGLGVQPSELAKLVAIFFIAALLERRMHRINELGYSLLPIGIVVARPGRR